MTIKYFSNQSEIKANASKIKQQNGVYLVANRIYDEDPSDFDQVIEFEGENWSIEGATEGDSVDSITLAGHYVLK
jgi:hypothetical protein